MPNRIGLVCAHGLPPEKGGRAQNEDNYLVCDAHGARYLVDGTERAEPTDGEGLLLAVCDGMGGHEHGQLASTTAARVMSRLHRPGPPADPARALLKYIHQSHHQLYWHARNAGPVTLGTTLTVCWLIGSRAAWAHVGDSRLYLSRNGQVVQLTADHTRNEFARRDGRPLAADGEALCQTFIYGSRGVGDNTALRLEAGLDSGTELLQPGDVLLLCTDGLSSVVGAETIGEVLELPDPQDAADALLALALRRGSTDNITALVVRFDGEDELRPSGSPRTDDEEDDDTFTF